MKKDIPTIREVFMDALVDLEDEDNRENQNVLSLIFSDLLKTPLSQSNRVFPQEKLEDLKEAIERVNNREPVQYVTGLAHFYGYSFFVDMRVLIPRPETEELIHYAIDKAKNEYAKPVAKIIDIGTGSGCIAITLAKSFDSAEIIATDKSPEALDVATINAQRHGVQITFRVDDLFEGLKDIASSTCDLVVSNPPYIREIERSLMSDTVLNYEPDMALFSAGDNPLAMYRSILGTAKRILKPGGHCLLELNEFLSDDVNNLASKFDFSKVIIYQDMQGKDRILHCVN